MPVDDFSVANPPTNARLLDALARDFVEHGYDRPATSSGRSSTPRTYQLSAVPNATNKFDQEQLRPLLRSGR